MPLYKQSELNAFLKSINTRAKKGLSQNFLIDGNIVQRIIQEAKIEPNDIILEIGPGPGVLTEAMQKIGGTIIAVEKDSLFAAHLPRLGSNIKVIAGDFLEQDLEKMIPPKTKVVANLPYSLTSPILEKLFLSSHLFERLILMVQKEVADRIVAKPGSKTYGALSVFCRFFTDPKIACIVKSTCFSPRPGVDSAVVHFTIKKKFLNLDEEGFFTFVKQLFSFRRKMISSSLKRILEEKETSEILTRAHLLGTERCETLSLEKLVFLYQQLV